MFCFWDERVEKGGVSEPESVRPDRPIEWLRGRIGAKIMIVTLRRIEEGESFFLRFDRWTMNPKSI